MRRTCAKGARLGTLRRSSPAHTTTTTTTTPSVRRLPQPAASAAARAHTWTWTQPRRRPSLPIVSRVYLQLLPHYYYHEGQHQHQQRAPTPAPVGSTPAAARSTMAMTSSPSSTQATPGSTQDGPLPQVANHTAARTPDTPNPSGAAAGHAADLRESAGEHGEAAAGGHEGARGTAEAAAGVEGEGGGGGGGRGRGDLKTLPAPAEGGNVRTLEVNGKPISLTHMGPMVVHKDGTLSRINNWGEMTETERQNTLRILVRRNQVRLNALRQGLETECDDTK